MLFLSCSVRLIPETSSTDGTSIPKEEAVSSGVSMTVRPVLFDLDDTKTSMSADESTGLSFHWNENDAVGVYSSSTGFARFRLVGGKGISRATFDGDGFALSDGETYHAFYPYALSASDKAAIPLSYTPQSVSGNDDTVSPMDWDYLSATAAADGGSASFSFSHLGTFLRLRLTGLPEGIALQRVSLVPMSGTIPETLSFNAVTGAVLPLTSSPLLSVDVSSLVVPASGEVLIWVSLPQGTPADIDYAVLASTDAGLFSARHSSSAFLPGTAYRWKASPLLLGSDPSYVSETATESGFTSITSTVGSGEYSGITYLGGTTYAVVHDKLAGGGILFFDIPIDDTGVVGEVSSSTPVGTSESTDTGRDNEGVAYVGSTGTLFVSSESDQAIREYDMTGRPTGRQLTVPDDLSLSSISSNKGFEALTYNETARLFWTITEGPLKKDAFMDRLLRLQSFGEDLLPGKRYLYCMDEPRATSDQSSSASSYVFGVSALAADDDGRVLVLEREVYVPNGSTISKALSSFTTAKIYAVHPEADTAGILRKSLVASFSTAPLSGNFANYEGMCFGPVLGSGLRTLVLIPDSQNGSGGLTQEYVKVLTL